MFGLVLVISLAQPRSATACIDANEAGQRLRSDGRYLAARAQFGLCAASRCPQVIRGDCAQRLLELEAATPTVIVSLRDAEGRDLTDVQLEVDGRATLTQLDGQPLSLDPGPHTLRLVGSGQPLTERVVLNASEKNRLVAFKVAADAPDPPAREVELVPPPPRADPAPAAASLLAGRGVRWGPLLTAATGGVAAGLWASFGLLARDQLARLTADPCAQSRTCDASAVATARAHALVADVALGVAATALVTALVWWLVDRGAGPGPTTAPGQLAPAAWAPLGGWPREARP